MDIQEIAARLAKPFPAADIEWRIGRKSGDKTKAAVVPYVTNRAIQNRLDEVMGIDGWCNKYEMWRTRGVVCGISINLDGDNWDANSWLTKWDGADETDIESTKGGLSDSMKRAAVQWGIGRYLYNLEEVWVPIDQYGKFTPPKIPDWALPEEEQGKTHNRPAPPQSKPTDTPPANNPPANTGTQPRPSSGGVITEAQAKRLYAIAHKNGWTDETIKRLLKSHKNYESTTEIKKGEEYDKIVAFFESNKAPAAEQKEAAR
jgi:hypothetical protein